MTDEAIAKKKDDPTIFEADRKDGTHVRYWRKPNGDFAIRLTDIKTGDGIHTYTYTQQSRAEEHMARLGHKVGKSVGKHEEEE